MKRGGDGGVTRACLAVAGPALGEGTRYLSFSARTATRKLVTLVALYLQGDTDWLSADTPEACPGQGWAEEALQGGEASVPGSVQVCIKKQEPQESCEGGSGGVGAGLRGEGRQVAQGERRGAAGRVLQLSWPGALFLHL